jgi:hypothetical protein
MRSATDGRRRRPELRNEAVALGTLDPELPSCSINSGRGHPLSCRQRRQNAQSKLSLLPGLIVRLLDLEMAHAGAPNPKQLSSLRNKITLVKENN